MHLFGGDTAIQSFQSPFSVFLLFFPFLVLASGNLNSFLHF